MKIENNIEKRNLITAYKKYFARNNEMGIPLGIKLFLTLSILVVTILIGVIIMLISTGTFTAGIRESKTELDKQAVHLTRELEGRYGEISVSALELSNKLSVNMEKTLVERGVNLQNLKDYPKFLNEVIGNEYETCVYAMEKASCSGVFIILNETVNPSIPGSEKSKAGLYIKNIMPSIINTNTPNTLLMRGNSRIGRDNSITLHPEWRMEFNIEGADYFLKPMEAAKKKDTELSRMYYWSPVINFEGSAEEVMFCVVPLIASDGTPFGVCGFEVSSMVFKLAFMPDNSYYQRVFTTLSPYNDSELDITKGFFAGGYLAGKLKDREKDLKIDKYKEFSTYTRGDGTVFIGLHRLAKLYPNNAVFGNEKWALALMLPKEDMISHVTKLNIKLILLLLLLFVCGMIGSYFLSKRYIKPIKRSIDIIKNSSFDEVEKTKIYEIDDLIEFLSSSKANEADSQKQKNNLLEAEKVNKVKADILPNSLFDEFVRNTKSLTPAEKAVFDLYVEGYTAKEITEILHLSINTIKTHNKRIYMKLDISSREELLLYVNMLKETGQKV